MTVTQLIAKIKRDYPDQQLDVVKDNSTATSNPNILSEINLAQEDMAARTLCIPESYTTTLTADQETFAIPSDWSSLDPEGGVWYLDSNSKWQEIDQKSRSWLDAEYESWMNATSSTPEYYFFEGGYIHIYPKSDTTRASGLRMYGGALPDAVTADSDVPLNGLTHLSPYHKLLALYVGIVVKGSFDDKKQIADKMFTDYLLQCAEMKSNIRSGDMTSDYSPDIDKTGGYFDHFRRGGGRR